MIVYSNKKVRMQRMMDALANNTDITDFSPGTIARTFLDIINEELEECYTTLDRYISMAYISTASGKFLDLMGAMLNCPRKSGDTDDNYRYLISQQVYSSAGANETTIRLKSLSVADVKDVVLVPYTYGIGSFSVYVMVDDPNTSDTIINSVQAVLDREKAYGIKAVAMKPNITTVDVSVKLVMHPSVSSVEASSLSYSARSAIKYYIDNISMGEALSINVIMSKALSVSDKIINGEVLEFKINNKKTYLATYYSMWDEKITPGNVIIK